MAYSLEDWVEGLKERADPETGLPHKHPCEVCGKLTHYLLHLLTGEPSGCTNGRCSTCHRKWCGLGGRTRQGHPRHWPKGHPFAPEVQEE